MNLIKLSVNANKLTVTEDCYTTGGSENYDKCQFTFDSEWTGFTKTAVFSLDDEDSYRVELQNDICTIPAPCIEKSGFLSIGVFGLNGDDVIITTNTIAHRVDEGVATAGEWIEQDNTTVQNAVNRVQSEIDEFKRNLSAKFSELLDKVTDETEINFEGYLPDWYSPTVVYDAADLPAKGSEYNDYLNFKLSQLATDFPNYVSRRILGVDSSEEYQIYYYTFNPGNYDKSIVITSTLHGSDRTAFFSLCYFLDYLCRDSDDKILAYIRNNVKLYVIPICNPYGLVENKVYNCENVNLEYNFPYKWSECLATDKGTNAGDQAETALISNFIASILWDKLSAVIDLHANIFTVAGRSIFYPKNHKNCIGALTELVNSFNYNEASSSNLSKAVLVPSNNPTLTNYVAHTFDLDACELVWTNSLYGGETNNNCYTKFIEFIGNTLYTMARHSRASHKFPPQSFTKFISWRKSSDTDVYTIPQSDTPVNMGITNYSMTLDMPCNIIMNGYVVINVTENCTLKINPILYQINSSEQEYADRLGKSEFITELNLTSGTHIIPLSTAMQAYFTSYNDSSDSRYYENAIYVLALSSSVANAATVSAFSTTLNAFPSDRAVPVEITRPMGLVSDYSANDIPTQTVLFPLGTVTVNDKYFND